MAGALSENAVVETIAEAKACGLSVQRVAGYGRTFDVGLVVEGKICQVIKSRQVIDPHYPNAVSVSLYLPRTEFADFLIYVAYPLSGRPSFYTVPRGVLSKDTIWSLESLEQYRDAWHVFKQPLVPGLTERRFTILNWQLQAVIKAAEEAALDVTLIRLKKQRPWPTFVQRRVIVGERKCAVYSCSRLSPNPTNPSHNFVFLRTPEDKWAEFQLCLVKDGPSECAIYVVPCEAIKKKTTVSLANPAFQPYKNNWKLLSAPISELAAITPIEWRQPKRVRRRKEVPEYLMKAKLQAQSKRQSAEPLPQRKEEELSLPDNYCYAGMKKVQIVSIGEVEDGRVEIGFSNGSVGSFSEEMAAGWTVGKEIEFSGSLGRLEVNLNNSLSIGMSLDEAKNRFPPLWVIYDHPKDFNAQIVVRVLFGMLSEPLPALLCDSLKEAREFVLSRGATVNLRRDPFDDPAIIEGWI
jgi:hypothetical protein